MTRRTVALALSFLSVAFAAGAEVHPDCGTGATALTSLDGYEVTIPPAGPDDGWCVLDGARLRSRMPGWPDVEVARLRLRQTATEVELDLAGLRAAPRPADREVDDRLRTLMRLQTADLRLRAVHEPEAGVLTLSGLRLELSGGTTLELDAEIRGASLSPASLALGAVTRAGLVWRSDGKVPRPVMEMAGEALTGATGTAAVDAARLALARALDTLPDTALDEDSRKALEAAIAALPQGRGKLTLTFQSRDGIGAARIAIVSLSGDPSSPEALQTIFDGATITARWQPGLAP